MKQSDITELLRRWGGDKQVIGQIVPAVYDELHSIAHQRIRRERDERSLNTTGLVHEALHLVWRLFLVVGCRRKGKAHTERVHRHQAPGCAGNRGEAEPSALEPA